MAVKKQQVKTNPIYVNKQGSTIPNGYKNHFADPVKDELNSIKSKVTSIETKINAIKAKTDTISSEE